MDENYIYYVELPCGNVKIGMTCNVKHRIQTMSSNVGKVILRKTWGPWPRDICRFVEKWLHADIGEYARHGREIFDLPRHEAVRILAMNEDEVMELAVNINMQCGGYA